MPIATAAGFDRQIFIACSLCVDVEAGKSDRVATSPRRDGTATKSEDESRPGSRGGNEVEGKWRIDEVVITKEGAIGAEERKFGKGVRKEATLYNSIQSIRRERRRERVRAGPKAEIGRASCRERV